MTAESLRPPFPAVFSVSSKTAAHLLPSGPACALPACSTTAAAALLQCWMRSAPSTTVVVTDSPRTLETLYQDVHTLSGGDMGSTAYFPGWENLTDADLQG
ncbi:MAG: hypothetical protein PF795_05845, partial [Kiritimatiellae bacterium]|nr:hypothetical protein [Kiritimatiellia bacterium]